jgi:hypothetical protein
MRPIAFFRHGMRKRIRNVHVEGWLAVRLAFALVRKERIERDSKAAAQSLTRN